ncbi:hypothetical protein GCM10007304_30540 [Rhodococcoides trifolii]|uniref:Luciferase-like domain-containing protein n=2 Tax=Rhodococcoides trifolii TaxID=908250 RepID=A0A917FYP3_9NOCA|nr:hypothetical protein GCM10007304_30540 [Rhodococcus trifolii]
MTTTTTPPLGTYGLWRAAPGVTSDLASTVEQLGFGTLWIGGSPDADLAIVETALEATTSLTVATGIVNIWSADAREVAASYHRLAERFPGRFLLGIGTGHPEATKEYKKPYAAMVEYLDVLDEEGVPAEGRVLAALGPRVMQLAADRSAGAHPYLTIPEHTRGAREILGPDKILAPEHKLVLEADPERAREIGRPPVNNPYLHLRNYTNNLERLGYSPEEIADGGSDRLIDALVAHGSETDIVDAVTEHLTAGADHVALHVLPDDKDPSDDLRRLAEVIGGR